MLRFIAVLVVFSICFADSAVMFEFPDGRTAAITSSGEIAMAAETVSIVPSEGLHQYFDSRGWLPMMEVRCTFELVNLTDEEQYISVGFPLDAKFGDSYTTFSDSMLVVMLDSSYAYEQNPPWWKGNASSGVDASDRISDDLDFRTRVNGEEVPVYYRTCARSLEEDLIWQPVVAVWRMRFQPGETVILENTYNTSWDYYAGGPWGTYSVNYILTTGGTWQGSIGDALISLTLPDDLPEPGLSDTLAVYWDWTGSPEVHGREVTWHYTDLNPDENLRFSVNTEQRVDFWENRLNVEEFYNAVRWTEEELLYTSYSYLSSSLSWQSRFDSVLQLRILETVPYLINGHAAPNDLPVHQFELPVQDGIAQLEEEHLQALEAVAAVRSSMEQNLDIVEQCGYLEFLPMFSNRYSWSSGDLDMFRGMSSREAEYLILLENLGAARRGERIMDLRVRAFYELTGWYHEGHESYLPAVPAEFSL